MQPAGSRRRARSGRGVCRTESRPVIPSIVLLGNLLVDDVVLADGTTRMGQPGGALLYGALGATLWESRPGLVSVLGDDYPAQVLEQLRATGRRSDRRASPGPCRRAYVAALRRTRPAPDSSVGMPAHEEVSPRPALIPSEWTAARAFHLAPMPFDVQRALLMAVRARPTHSSRSTLTCRSPKRRFTSGGKSSRTLMRSFLVKMNSCSKVRRRIPAGRFLASSTAGSASWSSSAGQRAASFTTHMTSAFTAGTLAPPRPGSDRRRRCLRCRVGPGAPRRASNRSVPATRGCHCQLRRRGLGT